jgi:hypothetical protein
MRLNGVVCADLPYKEPLTKPSFLKAALGAATALIAIPVMAGEIILFEHTDFGGRRMVIRDTMPNLDRTDFNDRAQSIIVREGSVGVVQRRALRRLLHPRTAGRVSRPRQGAQ